MDHCRIVHRESNILSKDHTSSPFSSWESPQQRRLTYLGCKTTREAFKLSTKCSDNRPSITLLWRPQSHTMCTATAFYLSFPDTTKNKNHKCDLYLPYIFWISIKRLEKSLAYLPLSWKISERSWRLVYLKKIIVTRVIWRDSCAGGSSHHAVFPWGFLLCFFCYVLLPSDPSVQWWRKASLCCWISWAFAAEVQGKA